MQNKGHRRSSSLESLGVLATSLLASVGVAILGLVKLCQRQGRLRPAWVWLWLGFFLPLLGVSLAQADHAGLAFVVTLLPICLVASFALQTRRRAAARGLLCALILLVGAFLADYLASSSVWQRSGFHRIGDSFGQIVNAPRVGSGTRYWSLPGGTMSLELSLEARHTMGNSGWAWRTFTPSVRLERLTEGDDVFTLASFPQNGDPYLMRTFHLGEPTGGKTFRATVTLRSQTPISAQGARGIWLQVSGPSGDFSALPVELGELWRTYVHSWTIPGEARDPVIRLILNNFNGHSIGIKDVRLEELRNGQWHRLEPLSPTGTSLTLDWQGRPHNLRSILHFLPTGDWRTYRLNIDSDTLRHADRVTAQLAIEPGLGVEVRKLSLSAAASAGRQPSPVPVRQRRSLWYGHPNNAGHVALVTGLAALLALRSGGPALVAVLLALGGMAFTGSRTAWLAGLGGLPWLLWFACRPRERLWVYPVLAAVGGVALAFLGLEGLGRLRVVGIENSLSRPEIWRVAWQALTEHPWTGVGPGPENFSSFFAAAYGGVVPEFVPNAHNLWLIFASEYGVFGLAAILWLTGGLTWLAWRWGRWRGIAFVLPVFALNFYDYSLFSWWVLFLVILGFNQLKRA
jgi:hypothetical protein